MDLKPVGKRELWTGESFPLLMISGLIRLVNKKYLLSLASWDITLHLDQVLFWLDFHKNTG
jgi:hypothetical protein